MIASRTWRNFDLVLFLALLLLAAFGVTMIYSATINTLGLGNPVQRQIVYVAVGCALLLLTASVDYRLLDLVQHPIPLLAPLALLVASAAVVVSGLGLPTTGADRLVGLGEFEGDLMAAALGAALIGTVYAIDRVWIRRIDLPLVRVAAIAAVAACAGVGAVFVHRQPAARVLELRPYLAMAGVALAYLADCLTVRLIDLLRNPLYVLTLGLLGVTLVAGQVSGGAQSWLGRGAIQPSEPAKLLVIVVLAKFLADREAEVARFGTVSTSIVLVALPVLLIYWQPDLGTALTLIPIWAAMIWMAGMRLRHMLALAAAGAAALPLIWMGLEDYMKARLLLFLSPSSDPDSYFNIHQALVSIGSGGWVGKGLTHGSQSQLHFLRVRHTDFVFAVTAEELGFLGAMGMIVLLALLVWRMLRAAEQARDTFGRLVATGVASVILVQSVINIGMNLGLMPVTGIPLPFVSYGGSSLITLMAGVGLVESVAMRHRKLEFD